MLARLVLVFAWCILPLMFGVELVGLLEDPTFSVGMICRFIRGAMDLKYLVQIFLGWTVRLCCLWRAASAGLAESFKSGVYRRALRVVFFIPELIRAAS